MNTLTARRQAAAEANRAAALAAFVAKKTEIDAMLARLQEASDNHFSAGPNAVTWAHVGSLEAIADQLAQTAAFANA